MLHLTRDYRLIMQYLCAARFLVKCEVLVCIIVKVSFFYQKDPLVKISLFCTTFLAFSHNSNAPLFSHFSFFFISHFSFHILLLHIERLYKNKFV